jgi:hypothetical protein
VVGPIATRLVRWRVLARVISDGVVLELFNARVQRFSSGSSTIGVVRKGVLLTLIAQFFSQEQDRKAEGFSSAKPAPKLPWIGLFPRRAQPSHHQQKKVAE